MVELVDGPCKGVFMVKRAPAPLFVRAVIDDKGETDLLDLVDDTPKKTEKIHIYQRVGEAGTVHIKMVKRSHSGYYAVATYRHMPDVDGEKMRDTATWRAWAEDQARSLSQ